MSVTVEGIIGLNEILLTFDTNTKRRVMDVIVKEAKAVQELAIQMAPVDHANLEKAIKIRGDENGRSRDSSGKFARREVEVYIDMDMPVPNRPEKTVGDYAYEMHEHLTPAGGLELGPKSVEKQNGSQVTVGGWFLTRALEEVDGKIDMDLVSIVFDV
jgi:hypothetical protein